MTGILAALGSWAAGQVVGVVFYAGLWWTLRAGLSSPRPALWFFASLLSRFGIVLAGFYFVSRQHWDRALWCLLGFAMARFMVVRLTRLQTDPALPVREHAHATQPG